MRNVFYLCLTGALLLSWGVSPSSAYTPIRTTSGELVRWHLAENVIDQPNIIERSVEFFINRDGYPLISDEGDGTGGEFDVLRRAFRVWDQEPTTNIRFNDLKLTNIPYVPGNDQTNLVYFDLDNSTGLFPPNAGIIALTLLTLENEQVGGHLDGRIVETDLVFNARDFEFAENPSVQQMDLLAVAVHEIGHICGLDHSFLHYVDYSANRWVFPTMYPYINYGDTQVRNLSQDDIAGVSLLYLNQELNDLYNGEVTGRVRVDEAVVYGVNVVAYQNGQPVASAITDADGVYRLKCLPAGQYILRAQTLSPNNVNTLTPIFTDFQSVYYGDTLEVQQATTVSIEAGEKRVNINFELSSLAAGSVGPTDNTPEQAVRIYAQRRYLREFSSADDEDWVRFTVGAGNLYQLRVNNLAVFAGVQMQLFDSPAEVPLATATFKSPFMGQQGQILRISPEQTKDMLVRLSKTADGSIGAPGSFEIELYEVVGGRRMDVTADGELNALDLFALSLCWHDQNPAETDQKQQDRMDQEVLLGLLQQIR